MTIPRVKIPPENGGSFIVNRWEGETFALPGGKASFHMFASRKQTKNAMAVFGWDGPKGEQGYHYHKITHDAFLITEGHLKIYCGDSCRILSPGDFASAPPLSVHNPMPLGPVTRALPLVSPADWVEIFRTIRDPFEGIMFPEDDPQDQLAEFNKRLPKNFEEPFDTFIVPTPENVETKEWSEADTVLPEGPEPYFLRYKTGPKWCLGGVTSQPFITTKQSAGGRFGISTIESSSHYSSSVFDRFIRFPTIHHIFVLLDGRIEVSLLGGEATEIYPGEVLFIDADTTFKLKFKDKYVRFMCYVDGDGLDALIHEAGERFANAALPDQALPIDARKVMKATEMLKVVRDTE